MIAPHNGLDWHLTVTVLSAYPLFTTALGMREDTQVATGTRGQGPTTRKPTKPKVKSEKAPKSAARSATADATRSPAAQPVAPRDAPDRWGLTLVVVESPTKARTISTSLAHSIVCWPVRTYRRLAGT